MEKKNKRSGFDTPAIGKTYKKGTKVVKNSDGTITLVEPKTKSKTKK